MKKIKGLFNPVKKLSDKIAGHNMPQHTMTRARSLLLDMQCASCRDKESKGEDVDCGKNCPPHPFDLEKTTNIMRLLAPFTF